MNKNTCDILCFDLSLCSAIFLIQAWLSQSQCRSLYKMGVYGRDGRLVVRTSSVCRSADDWSHPDRTLTSTIEVILRHRPERSRSPQHGRRPPPSKSTHDLATPSSDRAGGSCAAARCATGGTWAAALLLSLRRSGTLSPPALPSPPRTFSSPTMARPGHSDERGGRPAHTPLLQLTLSWLPSPSLDIFS